jgi:hypothetical protein
MSYAGDTDPKRFARFYLWITIRELLGEFQRRRFLVLAGPEAGDARALAALGVPPDHIVAVDRDAKAVEKARAAYGHLARFVHGDVLDIVKSMRHRFDAIFLDYCSPISNRTIDYTMRVAAWGLRAEGYIGAGFMYGREGPAARDMLLRTRSAMQEAMDSPDLLDVFKRRALQMDFSPDELNDLMRLTQSELDSVVATEREALPKIARLAALDFYMREAGHRLNMGSALQAEVTYRSARAGFTGTPMVYTVRKTRRPTRHLPVAKLHALFSINDDRHDRFDVPSDTEDLVRSTFLHFAEMGVERGALADLLCIPRTQAAAWLAVETRRQRAALTSGGA